MVGKVRGIPPTVGTLRIKGVVSRYYNTKLQRWIVRKWQPPVPKRSAKQLANSAQFSALVKLIKQNAPEDVIAATINTKGTPLLIRDRLMQNAVGNGWTILTSDGETWRGVRVLYDDIQGLLNSMTNIQGAIIVRDTDKWIGLNPNGTTAGQVLTSNGPGATPSYEDIPPEGIQTVTGAGAVEADTSGHDVTVKLADISPGEVIARIAGGAGAPSAISISDLLDFIGATEGDMLMRGPSGWEILALGASGKVLTSNGVTFDWETAGGGGGYSPGTPPTFVQAAIDNNGTDAITLSAAPTNGNLLVAMFFNPSTANTGSGWTQWAFNTSGTDYGVIAYKVAGAGESATQHPIASSPGGTGIIMMWEIHGQGASDFISFAETQGEFYGYNNSPLQVANAVNCIGLSAVSLVTGANIDTVMNVGTQDGLIASSGNRRGVMGHTDLASTPVCGIVTRHSASGNTKGATVLIHS